LREKYSTEKEGICAIGEHAARPGDDDEVGIAASIVNGVDAEFVVEPFQGLCDCGHHGGIDLEDSKIPVCSATIRYPRGSAQDDKIVRQPWCFRCSRVSCTIARCTDQERAMFLVWFVVLIARILSLFCVV